MRVVCLLFSDPKYILEIAEACYRWTPQIAVREGEAIFLEIEKCHRLYREETLILRLQALLRRFQTRAKISVADDVFMSLAWARIDPSSLIRVHDKNRNLQLPLEALLDVANPFQQDEDISKNVTLMIKNLKRLGLRNLNDFLNLPSSELASRFQHQALELRRRLHNGNFDESLSLWPRFIPSENIREVASLDYLAHNNALEPLLFVLRGMVDRGMARLAGRGERLTKFSLEFELEKFSTIQQPLRRWVFEFPLSQGMVNGLLPLIRDRLHFELSKQPLESSITKVSFEILETVPGQYFQRHFFNEKEEEQEAWNSLIMRLCEKLGRHFTEDHSSPAFVAELTQNYKPEKAWKRVIKEQSTEAVEQSTTGLSQSLGTLQGVALPLPERPLRVFPRPKPLQKSGNSLISHLDEHQWEIQDWEGPERLWGEWWGEEFKRDYFRVGTVTGEQLWVFRIPDTDHLFLHGYFD